MLQIKNASLRAGEFAVSDISLTVASKEFFVIMGPTGSGKSLLVKAICGIIPIQSGSIHIDGKDVTNIEPRKRQVGYVPQNSSLFPHLSVVDNILFPLKIRKINKKDAIRKTKPIVDALNISSLLERSTLNLSGGEQQKVALARALSYNPKLLILDEPVSALDEPMRCEICRLLKTIQQDFSLATIHICHNLEEARIVSDRIAIISKGRIVQTDTLENLIDKPKVEIVRKILRLTDKEQS
jgi:molybdate/tungstate transport system ATP-binding protein